jgi:hypothetical protein
MMSEKESIRLFYNDVVIQPYRIITYKFDPVRLHLSHNELNSEWHINAVSNSNSERAQLIATPGTFYSSEFRKEENDDQCNVIRIDFNNDACISIERQIEEPYIQDNGIKLRRAFLLLIDSGVISFVQEFEIDSYRILFDRIAWRKFENAVFIANSRLLKLFKKIINSLKEFNITGSFKKIPTKFFDPEGEIAEGHRVDLHFVTEEFSDKAFNELKGIFPTSNNALRIGDSEVYVGWSSHITRSYKGTSEPVCLSLIKISAIVLGTFVGASSISAALRSITIQLLSGNINTSAIEITNLILYGNQILLMCNDMKGLLEEQEAVLLEATNDACYLSREVQQFRQASESVIQGVKGLEQERTEKADKAIQILLLFLASITIVSVVKDAIDYWSLEVPPAIWYSMQSVILIGTIAVIILISYIFGRRILYK